MSSYKEEPCNEAAHCLFKADAFAREAVLVLDLFLFTTTCWFAVDNKTYKCNNFALTIYSRYKVIESSESGYNNSEHSIEAVLETL